MDSKMNVNTSRVLRSPVTHEAKVEFIHYADALPESAPEPPMTPEQQIAVLEEYVTRLESRNAALNTYASDLADQVNENDPRALQAELDKALQAMAGWKERALKAEEELHSASP